METRTHPIGSGRIAHGRHALRRALLERDPELGRHGDEVAILALDVGRHLRLDAGTLQTVHQAALVHDAGKLAIPRALLDKEGPLSEREWERIRQHPAIGAQMLAVKPGMAAVAELVLCAHERFDGRGYPDGLAGEEIPLGSRIIFACDAYDAMVSDRSYREAIPSELALGELRRCAGTQFDPVVVEVLCARLEGELSL